MRSDDVLLGGILYSTVVCCSYADVASERRDELSQERAVQSQTN